MAYNYSTESKTQTYVALDISHNLIWIVTYLTCPLFAPVSCGQQIHMFIVGCYITPNSCLACQTVFCVNFVTKLTNKANISLTEMFLRHEKCRWKTFWLNNELVASVNICFYLRVSYKKTCGLSHISVHEAIKILEHYP